MTVLTFFSKIDIDEKLIAAPDSGYQTALVIGSFVPFVLLVVIAYYIYYRFKNRKDLD
jgi:hypothetical protein